MPIELLESRIAPAVILTFTDVDGDRVDVVSNKALTASVSFTAGLNPSELLITGPGLDGASLAVLVKRSVNGDGVVNLGRISASGLDLGAVSVKGDLGKIVAGNAANPLPAIQSLTVKSMGILGTATQVSGNLISAINGDVGAITITGDALGVRVEVAGKIGAMKIGGDLRGDAMALSGRILAEGIKSLSIGGDFAAGAGDESGKIFVSGDLGRLSIGNSMFGASDALADTNNGQITVTGNAGPISIKRDVYGAVSEQKALDLRGNAGAITIGGSIFGAGGKNSGSIFVAGNSGAVTIGRDLNGGIGSNSGSLYIIGSSGAVKIGNDVNGSSGAYSAEISIGGPSNSLNSTQPNGGFVIGGDLRGGTGTYRDGVSAAQISIGPSTGAVRIGGSILGGPTAGSATFVMKSAKSFFLGGSIIGGGEQIINAAAFPGGTISMGDVPSVTVQGSIVESAFNGGFMIAGKVNKLLIRGSVIENVTASNFDSANALVTIGNLRVGRIEGSINGSPVSDADQPSVVLAGNIKKLEVLGSLDGDKGKLGGSLYVNGNAEFVKIGGSLSAGVGKDSGAFFAKGRIGTLIIGGGVESTSASTFSIAQVHAASFGKVIIAGDLVGGPMGAGEVRTTAGSFDSITVGGTIYGGKITTGQSLGVVKIGGGIYGGTGINYDSVSGVRAKSITIGGDLVARGSGGNSLIKINESAGPVKIGGDIRGTASDPAHLAFALTAGHTKPAFSSLAIKGSVTYALITGGIRTTMVVENADPFLGPVTVGGDWVASTIAAGVNRGADMQFASADDSIPANNTPAIASIAAITIKGQVLGTAASDDNSGFVAGTIGPLKIAGILYTASATPKQLSAFTDDVTLRLV